jgi:hypothetical protein
MRPLRLSRRASATDEGRPEMDPPPPRRDRRAWIRPQFVASFTVTELCQWKQSRPIQIPIDVGAGDGDRAGDRVGVGLGCRGSVGLVCVAGLMGVGVLALCLTRGCGGLDVGPPVWCSRVV